MLTEQKEMSKRRRNLRLMAFLFYCLEKRKVSLHKIQKLIFLAQEKGIPFSYNFEILPGKVVHSIDLILDIEELVRTDMINEEFKKIDPIFETNQILLFSASTDPEIRNQFATDADFQKIESFTSQIRTFSESKLDTAIERAIGES